MVRIAATDSEYEKVIDRLEHEVLEAAKEWNHTNHREALKCEQQLERLSNAVDALTEFERRQVNGSQRDA